MTLPLLDLSHTEAVYALFRAEAVELLRRGRKHASADGILHTVRLSPALDTKDGEGYKVNNNLAAQFARDLAREDPRFAGFFEFRKSKLDTGVGR